MSENKVITELTDMFLRWVGYCEKSKLSAIGIDLNNPESFTSGAGTNNYTIFAKVYKELTGINVQGQPWCDTFVDTMFIHKFGVDTARKLLGGFSAYTPTSANYFKYKNQYRTSNPKEGDIIFFKNSQRIYHTGYVRMVADGRVYTVEGNTSSAAVVENEGGCVAKKSYALNNPAIDGYGRPDYSIVQTHEAGWRKAADNVRWWFENSDGTYKADEWMKYNGMWFLFDKKGYMLTGLVERDGKVYALNTKVGSQEGALMVTNDMKEGNLVVKTDF